MWRCCEGGRESRAGWTKKKPSSAGEPCREKEISKDDVLPFTFGIIIIMDVKC